MARKLESIVEIASCDPIPDMARHFPSATFEIQPSVVSHTQCMANFPEMLDTKD